ncbi:peptide ABC transporter ATP-binding protein [Anoxybacter fermentans]|uniref:Peptide ABC transporter ATP-binding protein n=1 Tax=Anoxybacter fermentans TaxID=1323375 RepID=A0A3S9SYQ4_9FIRM|nr:ABC transporter ATP-binding protein [Anoxybacter fermentans]AZR73390.1 peptide ABC transporter ATP-binding protein [Anoxybacter fermentans]
MKKEVLLDVKDLKTYFYSRQGVIKSVDGVSFQLKRGEVLGLVGESGAGKSITGFSILRLISPPGKIVNGEIYFLGKDLLKMKESEIEKIRGNRISMVFQDPMTSLNPLLTIGEQLMEVLRYHLGMKKREAKDRAIELLRMVGIPSPEKRLKQYPHQFSGGMRQRVVIAIAMATNPDLIIADEPTTALDVTIQAQIIKLMQDLIAEYKTSMILISHDLAVVSEIADKIAVMYAGKIVEYGPKAQVIGNPKHPYTQGLLNSLPNFDQKQKRLKPIKGVMPNPLNLPAGCKFKPRCPEAKVKCDVMPELKAVGESHWVACHKLSLQAIKEVI